MRVLIVCNTFMQVIVAVHMRLKLYRDCDVDIMVSDHSVNADKVAEKLEKVGVFSRAKYVRFLAQITRRRTRLRRWIDELRLFMGVSVYDKMLWKNTVYDEFCYYNPYDVMRAAFNKSQSASPHVPEVSIFEEGILAYDYALERVMNFRQHPTKLMRAVHLLSRLTGRKEIYGRSKKFMCFHPELISNKDFYEQQGFSFIRLPPLEPDPEFLDIMNFVFSYDPSVNSFPQKYIYFATAAESDGVFDGETELVLKLADIVGKDNLLVKTHPRDARTIYRDKGLNVMENSSVPWEVIQLNHDFSGHVFVSLSSGSILNIMAMTNDNIPSYFLYPMVIGKTDWMDKYAQVISSVLGKLHAEGSCTSVKSISSFDDMILPVKEDLL